MKIIRYKRHEKGNENDNSYAIFVIYAIANIA